MIIKSNELSPNQIYHTIIQTIIPRPIAWVLSDNGLPDDSKDRFNLAPFSYFTPVSSNPPLLMFSVGKKPDGSLKDTRQNIMLRNKFVVHIANSHQAEILTQTSQTLPHGCSEIDQLNLQLTGFTGFELPRLSHCQIAFGCECYEIKEIGNVPQALIFGLITHIFIDDALVEGTPGQLKISAEKVDPLARIGGNEYWIGGKTIVIERPD